jgi:hypothetical protein
MKLAADTAGYLVVSLCREKKVRVVKVHHLVLLAFIGPRPVGAHGCHNDGNPKNNAIGNLRWDTPSGNNADKKKHGTDQIGERHPLSKLSKDQVLTIKQRLAQGDSCVAISKAFGVAAATISTIKNGRTWGWLKLPTHWKEAERAE